MKPEIISKDLEIKDNTKVNLKDINQAYSKYFKAFDWKIDYNNPKKTLDEMTALYEVQCEMQNFIRLRDIILENTKKITAAKKDVPDVVKKYLDYSSGASVSWHVLQDTSK